MQQVTVVIITNPFSLEREIHKVNFTASLTAVGYVRPFLPVSAEIQYSVNGVLTDNPHEVYLQSGDFLVVCPVVGKGGGGKNPLQFIAGIALSVVTMGVGGLASGLGWGASMSAWTFTGYLAAAATMYLGGQLLNSVFSPAMPDSSSANSLSSTPTYGWDNATINQTQGKPIPITYGTIKLKNATVLSQHVSNLNNDQYYSLLLCGGEGEIDGISDIRINDNPISNYSSVEVETRLGTNTQDAMNNFADTYNDQQVNYELSEDNWSTHLVDGNAANGLEVTLEFPSGLYAVDNNGNLTTASVDTSIQYRLVGGEWKDWGDQESYVSSSDVSGVYVYPNAPTEKYTISIDYDRQEPPWPLVTIYSNLNPTPVVITWDTVFDNGKIRFPVNNIPKRSTQSLTHFYQYISTKNSQGIAPISAASSSAVRRTFSLDSLPTGQYEVRAKVISRSHAVTSTRSSTRVYWVLLTSIIYDDFTRPGKVLVGIKALATSQLSGSLSSVSWIQTRSIVYVWNPNLEVYEEKPATNPAWACYDLIHLCKKLQNPKTGLYEYVNYGADKNLFVWQKFKDWADFCDERGLTVNILLDAAQDLWKCLANLEDCGRGKVMMSGTKFSCICDKPTTPVQMFTMGNIYMDTFQEEFLGLDDRANAIEVSFNNKAKGYERDSFTAYSNSYDTSTEVENPTQITLNGKTSYAEAYREAKYRLRLNQYLIRTCTFEADVDAIACQVGDVILLSHDVPQWGFSGRIDSATSNTVTLGREVEIEAGKSYGIYVRLQNDTIVYKAVKVYTENAITNIVEIASTFSKTPTAGDIFTFGEMQREAKPFRVVTITRSKELRRKLICLEYNEAVYNEADVIPQIEYSALSKKSLTLQAKEVFPRPNDNTVNVNVTWSTIRDIRYRATEIFIGKSESTYTKVYSSTDYAISTRLNIPNTGTWYIKVSITDLVGGEIAVGTTVFTPGIEYLLNPGNIASYYENNRIVLAIDPVPDYRTLMYEWRKGDTWSKSSVAGKTTQPSFVPSGDGHYWVSPVYNGVYAENPSDIIVIGTTIASNVLAIIDERATGWQGAHSDTVGIINDSVQLIGDTLIDDMPNFDMIESMDFAGGVASYGTYNIATANVIDIGEASMCNVAISYTLEGLPVIDTVDDSMDVDAVTNWDGDFTPFVGGTIQINVADNDGVFKGWQNFYSGNYFGRIYDFRVILTSTDKGVTPALRDLVISVDAPDVIDTGVNVLVPAEGLTVGYNRVFHAIPGPQVTILDAEENDIVYLPVANQTKQGFFIQVKNGVSGVERHINWLAQKY